MRDDSDEKAKGRFALIVDVDGVLTDDTVMVNEHGQTIAKSYCVEDFQVLKRLAEHIPIYIITGEQPEITAQRLNALCLLHTKTIGKRTVGIQYINTTQKLAHVREIARWVDVVHFIGNSVFTDVQIAQLENAYCYTPAHSSIKRTWESGDTLLTTSTYGFECLDTPGGEGVLTDWLVNHFRLQEEETWNDIMSPLA